MYIASDLFEKVSRGYDVKHFALGANKLAFRKGARTSTGWLLAADGALYELTRFNMGQWEIYRFDLADGIPMFVGYFDSATASMVSRFAGIVFWLNLLDSRRRCTSWCHPQLRNMAAVFPGEVWHIHGKHQSCPTDC